MRRPPTEIWAAPPHIDRPDTDLHVEKETKQTQQVGCAYCDPMQPPPMQIFFVSGTSVCKEHKNV